MLNSHIYILKHMWLGTGRRIGTIADECNMSYAYVRESLKILQSQGLVESHGGWWKRTMRSLDVC